MKKLMLATVAVVALMLPVPGPTQAASIDDIEQYVGFCTRHPNFPNCDEMHRRMSELKAHAVTMCQTVGGRLRGDVSNADLIQAGSMAQSASTMEDKLMLLAFLCEGM